jgi:uncharacterized membrane protein
MWEILGFIIEMINPLWAKTEAFYAWSGDIWLGKAIADSIWLFPFVETIHILAMAVMFGGMLVLNLRLMGLTMNKQGLPMLARTLQPFINWGVVIMLISGYVMFTSEAMKCFVNDGFKIKMFFLFLVLVFQYTIYNRLVKKEDVDRGGFGPVAAILNFFLWFMVGAGGRAIGFV